MGKVFYFGDAWTRNEEEAQRQGVVHEGWEQAPVKDVGTGRKRAQLREDASLGLDGQDVHVGGDRVTLRAEERTADGVVTYWQNERGGTYRQRWIKDGERRLRPAERPKRIYSF